MQNSMESGLLIYQSNGSIESTIAVLPNLKEQKVKSLVIGPINCGKYKTESYRKLINEAHSLNIKVIQKATIESRSMINTSCMALVQFFTLIITLGVDAILFDNIGMIPKRNLKKMISSFKRLNPDFSFYGTVAVNDKGLIVLPEELTFWERLYYFFKGRTIGAVSRRYSSLLDGMIDETKLLSLNDKVPENAEQSEHEKEEPNRIHLSVDDMVMSDKEREDINEILSVVQNVPEIVGRYSTSKSLLKELNGCFLFVLVGPPGSGKTLRAQMLADVLGREYIEVSLANILGRLVGDSEKHLSELFATAEKEHQILIFNEGDALFCSRSNSDSAAADNKLVSHALTLLENSRVDCFITTNRADAIDFAVKSRIMRTIKVNAPSAECLGQLYEKNLHEFPFLDRNIDYLKLGEASEDFSYRDVNKTILIALGKMAASSKYVLTQSMLEDAIRERVNKPNVSEESLAQFVEHTQRNNQLIH